MSFFFWISVNTYTHTNMSAIANIEWAPLGIECDTEYLHTPVQSVLFLHFSRYHKSITTPPCSNTSSITVSSLYWSDYTWHINIPEIS